MAFSLQKYFLCAVLILGGIGQSQAGVADTLRERDYLALGDNKITFDVRSNREWLDLTESRNHSFLDMIGPQNDCFPNCTTGEFKGWTLAREADVVGLFRDVGFIDPNTGSSVNYGAPEDPRGDEIWLFTQTLGVTGGFCQGECWKPGDSREHDGDLSTLDEFLTQGITRTLYNNGDSSLPDVAVSSALWGALGQGSANVNSPAIPGSSGGANTLFLPFDVSDGQTGVWLYRTVPAIPEPETYALMLAGLGLIGFMLRRKKANNS